MATVVISYKSSQYLLDLFPFPSQPRVLYTLGFRSINIFQKPLCEHRTLYWEPGESTRDHILSEMASSYVIFEEGYFLWT